MRSAGCQAVAWLSGGVGGLRGAGAQAAERESIEEAIANLREATSLNLEEFPAGLKGYQLVTMFSVPAHA